MKKIHILDPIAGFTLFKTNLNLLNPSELMENRENIIKKSTNFLSMYTKPTIFNMMNEPKVVMKLAENICGYRTLRGFSRLTFNQGHVI